MRILITGGLGFVGAHLVSALGDEHVIDIVDGFDLGYPGFRLYTPRITRTRYS